MLYSDLPHDAIVTISEYQDRPVDFPAGRAEFWLFPVAYEATLHFVGSKMGVVLGDGEGAESGGTVIGYSQVACIYAPGGIVRSVAVYHAYVGFIPDSESPMKTKYDQQ